MEKHDDERGDGGEKERPTVVHLFVDDSNLWIEGQKAVAKHLNLQHRTQDVRYRVNLKFLLRFVARNVGAVTQPNAHLFVSQSPHTRSVWEKATDLGFKVHIFERNQGPSHHEKEVDQALSVEIAFEAALSLSDHDHDAVFAIVTGDRDIRPAIQKALGCQIPVYLMAFSTGLSGEYDALAKENPNLHTILLDEHVLEIGFIDYWSGGNRVHAPHKAAVISPVEARDHTAMHKLCRKLHPLQEQFFISTVADDALAIEFPHAGVSDALLWRMTELLRPSHHTVTVVRYDAWRKGVHAQQQQHRADKRHQLAPTDMEGLSLRGNGSREEAHADMDWCDDDRRLRSGGGRRSPRHRRQRRPRSGLSAGGSEESNSRGSRSPVPPRKAGDS